MTAIISPSNAMIALAGLRSKLDHCPDLEQIHDLRDRAETIRHYAKAVAMGLEVQNEAAEVKLRCERQAGEILTELHFQGGDHKSNNRDHRVTLEDLGISGSQSSRWQRESSVPEEDYLRYVKQANEESRELTSRGLLRLARLHAETAKRPTNNKDPFGRIIDGLKNLARQQVRFGCIYADPPWFFGKKNAVPLGKKLCGLPVKLVVAQQAHLHLWVPPELLESGLAVLRAWGFRYKAVLVRSKVPQQYGDYWRQEHDMLLLGVRGSLPFRDTSLPSWLDGHDESPANSRCESCNLIARVSQPPFLDLFGNAVSTGWTSVISS